MNTIVMHECFENNMVKEGDRIIIHAVDGEYYRVSILYNIIRDDDGEIKFVSDEDGEVLDSLPDDEDTDFYVPVCVEIIQDKNNNLLEQQIDVTTKLKGKDE